MAFTEQSLSSDAYTLMVPRIEKAAHDAGDPTWTVLKDCPGMIWWNNFNTKTRNATMADLLTAFMAEQDPSNEDKPQNTWSVAVLAHLWDDLNPEFREGMLGNLTAYQGVKLFDQKTVTATEKDILKAICTDARDYGNPDIKLKAESLYG